MQGDCLTTTRGRELIRGDEEPRAYGLRTQSSGYHERERGQVMISNELLVEALWIAKDNFDYDGEYDKANKVESYINKLEGESNE